MAFAPEARPDSLKISGLEVWRLEGHAEQKPLSLDYLTIHTDAGIEGTYGPIDDSAIYFLERQFAARLKGQDPLAVEALWDTLFRASESPRGKAVMSALSAVDNALWDLRGRYYGQPVYRLLGGPTRPKIDVYAACMGYSHEPEALRQRIQSLQRQGFNRQKWFFTRGPADGLDGLRENVDLARRVRETLGEDGDAMFDCHAGWNLDYAIAWARQAEPFRPRWVEECFPPEQVMNYARLRRSTSIPVASGEHLYGRWSVFDYLKSWALNIAQPDPEWSGGIGEAVRICAIASLFDVPVMPHASNLRAALHVVASQSPAICPLLEYPVEPMKRRLWFEKNPPHPSGGQIALDEAPGFGIELDSTRVERRTRVLAA
ncbi:MAG: enolase C-terminal domain-like protein [Bryobacteraceae bacterium]